MESRRFFFVAQMFFWKLWELLDTFTWFLWTIHLSGQLLKTTSHDQNPPNGWWIVREMGQTPQFRKIQVGEIWFHSARKIITCFAKPPYLGKLHVIFLPQIPDFDFDEACGNPDFFPTEKNPPQKIRELPRASSPLLLPAHTMPGEGFSSGPAAVPVLLPTLRLASRKLLVMEVGVDFCSSWTTRMTWFPPIFKAFGNPKQNR